MISVAEEWREVIGNPFYQVSDLGRVRSVDREFVDSIGRCQHWKGKNLNPTPSIHGYLCIDICFGGKKLTRNRKVHHLVAEAWLGPKPEDLDVNHVDGDKKNNKPENLEYVTRSQNIQHAYDNGLMFAKGLKGENHPAVRLTEAQVRDAQSRHKRGELLVGIAKEFGVDRSTVSSAVNGKTWKHLKLTPIK